MTAPPNLQRDVYLDHAATTPMDPRALTAMTVELARIGNPSAVHSAGRRARQVVEESREQIGALLGAHPSEVVFTSGGTESDNLAIKGLAWARRAADPSRRRIVVTAVEHHAVLETAEWLAAHDGFEITMLPVDHNGLLDLDALRQVVAAHGDEIAVISVMWANNEVGTVQPIDEVVDIARPAGIPVHSDAVQAVGQLPVDFAASGLSALTTSAHKLGGPIGTGTLLVRRDMAPVPVLHGGGHERGLRSGTLNAPAVRAFAVALDSALVGLAGRAAWLATLRDQLIERIASSVPGAVLDGPRDVPGLPARRLPANVHFRFPGAAGESLLFLLDQSGIQASLGSACQAGVAQASHVLLAMGVSPQDAVCGLRFTLGATSTEDDVNALLAALPGAVERVRALDGTRRTSRKEPAA